MANSYFEFKQFRIDQDQSAMKVTTDACILGAYAPIPFHGNILDIGTGTGLLALMLAQRTNGHIDAIENDEQSFLQAKENFSNSSWAERIRLFHDDVKDFVPEKSYDFIICNPPFFENQLRSPSPQKNLARHNVSLDATSLLNAINRLLQPQGQFAALLPYEGSQDFIRKARGIELYPAKQLLIRDRPDKSFIRMVIIFQRTIPLKTETEILSIKNEDGNYSDFFQQLLKDFYLYL